MRIMTWAVQESALLDCDRTEGESRDGRKWARLSDLFPRKLHRLVQIEIGLDAHWMLHNDTKIYWGREQAEEALRSSVGAWVSWNGGSEEAAQVIWVNEVQGCTILAKTRGKGAGTRRWW